MKPAFDRVTAAVGLTLLSPLLLLVAVAVVIEDGFPVFFLQTRLGQGGRRFRLLKFRTMRAGSGGVPLTTAGDRRVTAVGRVLRKYKIDELAQLWNVLLGEMSLVGPRPEVPRYVVPGDPVWRAVQGVKPGITDLASLLYRHEEEILAGADDPERHYRETVLPAKLQLNVVYIERQSFWLDCRLILWTVRYSWIPAGFDPSALRRKFFAQDESGTLTAPAAANPEIELQETS